MTIGKRAATSSFAAASISTGDGAGACGTTARGSGSTCPDAAMTSHAISIATGPGRPDSICLNASSMIAGTSAARSIRAAHLVSVLKVPS